MRTFLYKASCVLSIAFLICGKAASPAYGQQTAADTTLQPAFISGMAMEYHSKNALIANLVAAQKNSEKRSVAPTGEKKTPEELINYLIKKYAPAENKEMAPTAAAEKIPDTKDTVSTVVTTPQQTQTPDIKQAGSTVTAKSTTEEAILAIDEEVDPIINKYAEMISVEPRDISNYPLYRFIDKWYGTRYKWGGIDMTGIDCSAFTQKLYGEIYGMDIVRTARQQHRSSESIKQYLDANEGDLIFFRIHRLRISHVGVYLANGYFVHASRSHGVMISSMNDRYWSKRYAGCGRIERDDRAISESDFIQ